MILYLVLALFFITLQGFFAGMETGMVSIMRPRAEHAVRTKGGSSARIILFFMNHPGIMIATTLIGVNISVVGASLMSKKFMELCGLTGNSGILISTCILSIILLSCEIIPKNWFRQAPFERCSLFAWPLYFTYCVMIVPVRLFAFFTAFLNRRFAASQKDSMENAVIREDFRLFLRESEGFGSVDTETACILDRAMGFPDLTLADIMIPKEKVFTLPSSVTVREAFEAAKEHSLTKIPIYISVSGEKNTQWCGIFNVYEAMFSMEEGLWDKMKVTACMAPIHALNAQNKISRALQVSKQCRVSLFVVADANGGHIGTIDPGDVASMLFE